MKRILLTLLLASVFGAGQAQTKKTLQLTKKDNANLGVLRNIVGLDADENLRTTSRPSSPADVLQMTLAGLSQVWYLSARQRGLSPDSSLRLAVDSLAAKVSEFSQAIKPKK